MKPAQQPPSPVHAARGFSLVELMVALTIGMILLTLLAVVFANSSQSQKEITAAGQQIESGRYAIEILSEDIRHAGYYGYFNSPSAPPAAAPAPCSVATATIKDGLTLPIYGYDSPATKPSALTCIADADFTTGNDILVVRRASTLTTAVASLDANTVYIQGTASPITANNPVIDIGSNTGSFTLKVRNGSGANVDAPIRKYETHIYFVAPCSNGTGAGGVCQATDDGGTPIPTLKRMELSTDSTGATAMVIVPLVEGIEKFQAEYGLDGDSDGAPDADWSTVPTSTANWQTVMAVRVYVLARNLQITQGYTNNKAFHLGDTTVFTPTAGDRYRRHVFEGMIRIKNPSERKETP